MVNPFQPWKYPARLFRAATYVALGLPVGIVVFTVTFTLSVVAVAVTPAFLIGVPIAWVGSMVAHGLADVERSRAGVFHRRIGNSVAPLQRPTWLGRLAERATSKARWREVAHHISMLPIGVLSYVVTAASWCGSLALVLLPFYVGNIPDNSAKFYFFDIGSGTATPWIAAALGVVGLAVVAPWVTIGAATAQWSAADRLLGPSGDERLTAQVTELRTSRTAAVDSAEAERRRIERDLHDGAQQRLVSLAAGLGLAREQMDHDPDSARASVTAAHEEAKSALREIRDLIRGIHPVILQDRGIDAALSAVVARSAVPVSIDVRLDERPPPAVESATYFVVTEALTNVDRHSGATRAEVSIARTADRVVVEIRDNGHGGADASRGTGLDGLRERIAGMGGSMYVISPTGGPTTISVEIPCVS